MAIDVGTRYAEQVEYNTPIEEAAAAGPAKQPFTAVIVFTQGQWTAVCWELDIAAQADSRDEAVAELIGAVRAALEWAAEKPGRVPGEPVPPGAMVELIRSHDAQSVNTGVAANLIYV
jgi:predicted RNase H-like HicB family nuclease